jgi:hypothetical protein
MTFKLLFILKRNVLQRRKMNGHTESIFCEAIAGGVDEVRLIARHRVKTHLQGVNYAKKEFRTFYVVMQMEAIALNQWL